MKQKLGRKLLERELRERGYTGDVNKLIESVGSLNKSLYFWENQFRQEVDYYGGNVSNAWIEDKFKKDAKVFYNYHMRRKFIQVTGCKNSVAANYKTANKNSSNGRKI